MNKQNNIFTNGNLVPMFICTPVAVILSALAVTLICLPFGVAPFLETFLYSCLLFLVVAAIVEVPMLIVDFIKLMRHKAAYRREQKRKNETFVLLINNGNDYVEKWEVFEFGSRSEAVAYKSKLIGRKDNRHMIVTTLHCAEKCYGITREEE